MKTELKRTVKILQEQVYKNLEEIRKNEKQIRELLNKPVSESRSQYLNEKQKENKKILNENKEAIKVQHGILRLLNVWKIKEDEVSEIEDEVAAMENEVNDAQVAEADTANTECRNDPESCFQMTIKGSLSFDEDHPYYGDIEFIDRLLGYYTETEEYEECNRLMDIRNRVQKLQSA